MGAAQAEAFRKANRIALETEDGTSEQFRPVGTFADAGFSETVLRATKAFAKPTPIQAQCWPIANDGRDVVAIAKTGSGKTLGYLMPIFHRALTQDEQTAAAKKAQSPFAIVLAPVFVRDARTSLDKGASFRRT